MRRVDRDYDHRLGEQGILPKLLVVVAAQQQNVDALLRVERRRGVRRRGNIPARGRVMIAQECQDRHDIDQRACDQGQT